MVKGYGAGRARRVVGRIEKREEGRGKREEVVACGAVTSSLFPLPSFFVPRYFNTAFAIVCSCMFDVPS